MSWIVERTWTTKAGLRAVCVLVNESHRCGYVEVTKDHPLYGIKYHQHSDVLKDAYYAALEGPIGKRGALPVLCRALNPEEKYTPDFVFDVHGSITFTGFGNGYPADGGGWWFGFDCLHAGDGSLDPRLDFGGPVRTEEYVVEECERLAQQIVAVAPLEATERTT